MLERIKQLTSAPLIRNSFIYIISDGINKAIPFMLLPFLSYYLTPSDYGLITNFNVLIQILSVFCYTATAGIIPVIFYKLDERSLKRHTSNMVFLNTYAIIGCLFVLIFLNRVFNNSLRISFAFQLMAVISVWFASISNINMVLWRCEEKPIKFGIYQISQTTLDALFTIILVILLVLGWQGRIYSMLFSAVMFGFLSLFILFKQGYIVLKQSRESMKQIAFYAVPLIPHALSFWLRSGVDKILLTKLCGLTENGLYSVAMTWGAIVSLFSVSFSNAYTPFLYKKLTVFDNDKEGTINEQKRLVKMIYCIILLSLVFVVLSYVFAYFFIKVVYNPSYYGALEFLPYVMVSQYFNICYLLFVCFAHYTLRTKVLGAITLSLSVFQIVLSYLFINLFGAVGAAISSAVIMVFTFMFVARFSMKIYKLPWFSIRLQFRVK